MFGLRRLSPERFARSFDQLAALLVLNLLVWAALDTLHAEPGSQLMLDGLYGWAFYLLIALFACALVARAYSEEANTRSLLVPALSVAPYVLIAFWLLSDLSRIDAHPLLEIVVAVAYLLVLGIRVLQAAYGVARGKAVVTAAVFIIAAPWMLAMLNLDTRLWLTDDVDETQQDDSAAESIFYEQPARIAAAVDDLAAPEGTKPSVFYLGFAGDGEQAIFRREALFAEQVFGEHFGSGDRSVELINDDEDLDSYPIATASGLSQALKLIASRMDVENDVLVLFLTSHGSEDGLAVVNGTLPLMQLSPTELRRSLDESGIKWRVVVVSACYSGVFVDALKGDDTLVITAADAEHSSFGCDDDRELTYFGEAFLQDSVPGAPSLEEAFKKAAELVRRREVTEHKTPSNPQISIGPGIRERLLGIEGASAAPRKGTIVASR